MITVIAAALIETFTKHMFQKYLNEQDKIEIGKAPSWYMKPVDDKMCVFTHKQGGLESVEIAKGEARIVMRRKIDGLITVAVSEQFKRAKTPEERALIEKWKDDPDLPIFIQRAIDYSRVSYEDEINTTFMRACILKTVLIDYEKKRLQAIGESLAKHRANKAMDELESTISQGGQTSFDELNKMIK
ncbi:MAG: hypothetical protein K6347_06430 [Campylobacterales bacterium]